jgi:hypothetical protein
MRNMKKLIITFLFFYTFFGGIANPIKAESQLITPAEVPHSSKIVSLRLKNKPLSQALKVLAGKAKINLIVAPDFQDGNISLNLRKVPVSEVFSNLMSVGNFELRLNEELIIARTPVEAEQVTDVISLNNAQAVQVAYSLNRAFSNDPENVISYDEISNSIILEGNKSFVDSTKRAIIKLDLPKKVSSFKLDNYTAKQMAELLNKELFKTSLANQVKLQNKSYELEPIFDESTGIVLKGIIQKQDNLAINAESPVIIAEDKKNEITIIGNSHQIALAKELMYYLEGKKIDKDEEIRRAHNEIYETKQQLEALMNEMKNSQMILADAAIANVENNIELEKAISEIDRLNKEIDRLKSQKVWTEMSATPDNKDYEKKQKSEALQQKISSLESELFNYEEVVNSFETLQVDLEKQIAEKDKQLAIAYEELTALKARLGELSIQQELHVSSESDYISLAEYENAQKQIAATKSELFKAKEQLRVAKNQLELIFGGKFLETTRMPETKSRWFK